MQQGQCRLSLKPLFLPAEKRRRPSGRGGGGGAGGTLLPAHLCDSAIRSRPRSRQRSATRPPPASAPPCCRCTAAWGRPSPCVLKPGQLHKHNGERTAGKLAVCCECLLPPRPGKEGEEPDGPGPGPRSPYARPSRAQQLQNCSAVKRGACVFVALLGRCFSHVSLVLLGV